MRQCRTRHWPNREATRRGRSGRGQFPAPPTGPLNRVLLRVAVQEHVQFRHFGNPTAIEFAIKLDCELHSHSLPSPMRSGGRASGEAPMVVDQKRAWGPQRPNPTSFRVAPNTDGTVCAGNQINESATSRSCEWRIPGVSAEVTAQISSNRSSPEVTIFLLWMSVRLLENQRWIGWRLFSTPHHARKRAR